PIPCTRSLTYNEVEDAYEKETGKVIVETFKERKLDPTSIPGVIVSNHGPFTWGKNASQAIYHSVVLEEVAKMNRYTKQINPCVENAPSYI
ncbi:class II aldolase/adducin family protein, partial [Staphylococcus pasteuri]